MRMYRHLNRAKRVNVLGTINLVILRDDIPDIGLNRTIVADRTLDRTRA